MEKEFISVFVTLLIITAAASAATIDRDTDETHEKTFLVCPADFEMLIYCGGFDTWNPIYMLYANATGDTFYYILKPEDRVNGNFTLVSRFNFTDDEIGQIWDEIVANDFFNLNDHYARESVVDGTFANITVTGNGVTHTVQTENIDVDRFDSIVKTVNSLTPGDNDLYYNALVNHAPVKPGKPVGPVNGTVRKECSYTSVGFDIDGDDFYFMFDWGDGTSSGWQGPYKSGENITLQHSWNRRKTYNIRVKAIDDPNGDGDLSDGVESEWSDPLAVSMPRGKQLPTTFYIKLLENIVKKFPFLKHLLNIHDPPNFPFYTPDLPRFSVEPSTSKDGGYNPNSGSRAKIEECTITIEVHIALYGEWINKASDDWIKTLKDKIEKDIESKWNRDQWDKNGDGKPDGEQPWRVKCKKGCPKDEPGCVVKFDAEVVGKKNVSSKDLPTGGKAKSKKAEGYHWVHVADPRRPQSAHVNAWDSKLPTPNDGSETTGAFNVNDYAGVYAHEAGHLWGLKDQQKEIEREVNGKKVKYKYPSKKNEDGTWNIMAWPGGWPSQADIDEIVKNSGIECPCKCCPEENDTKKPKVKITEPTNNSKIPFSQPQHIIGYASDDESGVAELDYLLEWDGGSYDGASIFIYPPENHVDFTLGPIVPDDFVDPDDNWLKITIFATDAAGNTGSDSVTILRLEEDTTPPFTEKEIGEPKEEGGYIIWPSTPIWLNATDEESGVNHIYYQIAWDIDEDGTWDEFFEETVYGDTAEIQLQYWGITYGKIELRWYAVDNAENTEEMHYQQHLVATW